MVVCAKGLLMIADISRLGVTGAHRSLSAGLPIWTMLASGRVMVSGDHPMIPWVITPSAFPTIAGDTRGHGPRFDIGVEIGRRW